MKSGPCRQEDWARSDFLSFWQERGMRRVPYHCKHWELWKIADGILKMPLATRGIGFGVGNEPIPSWLCEAGLEVLETDLDPSDPDARQWAGSGQLSNCKMRVDMWRLPASLRTGSWDFVWSTSALEHLGSLSESERFIVESLGCLRPGGIAFHVTEACRYPGVKLDKGPVCAFGHAELVRMASRINREFGQGSLVLDLEFGTGPLDLTPDKGPAWKEDNHLSLLFAGVHITSFFLAIRPGGWSEWAE